jgi:hypothetical protein
MNRLFESRKESVLFSNQPVVLAGTVVVKQVNSVKANTLLLLEVRTRTEKLG